MAFHDHNFFQEGFSTPVYATGASSMTVRARNRCGEVVLFLHVHATNTGGAAPVVQSITDTEGLTWTLLSSVSYDGTNGTLHAVYWAKQLARSLSDVTVTFTDTTSASGVALVGVMGAHVTSPKDLHADALKTESHTTAAQSSVSGFSTTAADTVLLAFYASRTTTAPGTLTGFTSIYTTTGTNSRMSAWHQLVGTAQSSQTYTVGTSTATGSFIVVGVRPRQTRRKEIRWFQGFERYHTAGGASDADAGSLSNLSKGRTEALRFSNGSWSLQTGRGGVGNALRITGISSATATPARVRFSGTNADFGVTGGNSTTGLGSWDNILDGQHVYFGFNVKIGTFIGAGATGYQTIFTFGAANEADKPSFLFDIDNRRWGLVIAPGTSSLQSPANVAPDLTKVPSLDPFQRWVWVEVHLYRHATNGRIEMWQERSSPGEYTTIPPSPFYRGILPPKTIYQEGAGYYGMEKIFDYTGDTSVATLGVINQFVLTGDNKGGASGRNTGNDFDDLVFSTGDRMGEPCFVRQTSPTGDVSVSGWSPSAGSTNYEVLDETTVASVDYVSASTGNPRTVLSFSGTGIGYTPKSVLAVQAEVATEKPAAGNLKDLFASLKSGSSEPLGYHREFSNTVDNTLLVTMERDPATRGRWSFSAALAADLVFEVKTLDDARVAQSLADESRVTWAAKTLLITREAGSGAGGDEDVPETTEQPDLPPTNNVPWYNDGFPLEEGLLPAFKAATLPSDKGIAQ